LYNEFTTFVEGVVGTETDYSGTEHPKVWLVFGNPTRVSGILHAFPILRENSIFYKYCLKKLEDLRMDG